jgi:Fur family peroxide stress response transcriptional regulator
MPHADSPIETRLAEFAAVCQRSGFRATPQRLEVFRQVVLSGEHPDAEDVCARVRERMPTVALDTVYRTLKFLEEAGLIQRLSRLHGSARFDGNIRQHHHYVCTECGRVWDFYSPELDRMQGPREVAELGAVKSFHAELHGVCTACQAEATTRLRRAARAVAPGARKATSAGRKRKKGT